MPGLLLAGDAAGFIDPMTGDGLRFAFAGARLAADAVGGLLDCTLRAERVGAITPEISGKYRLVKR